MSAKLLSEYSDEWMIAQGTYAGEPLSVRYRPELLDAEDFSDYPFQIGVAVPFPGRVPRDQEAENLWSLENALENVLGKEGEVVFVASITSNSMREFVFYAKEWKPEYFEQKVKDTFQESAFEPQFMMQRDENWNTYRQFVKQ